MEWGCPEAAVVMLEGGEITEATLINCSMTAHWHTHTHTQRTQKVHRQKHSVSLSLSLSLSVSHRVTCLVHVLETVRLLELTGKISRQRGGKETDERGQPDDLSRHKRSMCQLSMCSWSQTRSQSTLFFFPFHPLLFPSLVTCLPLLPQIW